MYEGEAEDLWTGGKVVCLFVVEGGGESKG